MRNDTFLKDNGPITSEEILKVTALLYLKEALRKEQYEGCPELIRTAKGFGARQSEVRKVIVEYIGTVKGRFPRNRITNVKGGRPRF